jgi:large subunit ribosomal protein L30
MSAAKKTEVGKIKITQVRSLITQKQSMRDTVAALGLKRIRHSVVHEDNAVIRGMVFKVKHLVEVESVK